MGYCVIHGRQHCTICYTSNAVPEPIECGECAKLRAENEQLKAEVGRLLNLLNLIFESTLPYNNGENTFSEKVVSRWAELSPPAPEGHDANCAFLLFGQNQPCNCKAAPEGE